MTAPIMTARRKSSIVPSSSEQKSAPRRVSLRTCMTRARMPDSFNTDALVLSDSVRDISAAEIAEIQELATGRICAIFGLHNHEGDCDEDVGLPKLTVSLVAVLRGCKVGRVRHSRLIVTENEVLWYSCKPGKPTSRQIHAIPFESLQCELIGSSVRAHGYGLGVCDTLHAIGFTTKPRGKAHAQCAKFACFLSKQDVDFIVESVMYQKDMYDAWVEEVS